MDKHTQLRVLFVGLGTSEVTFLNRLIDGLVLQGVHVTISGPCKKIIDGFPAARVDWLWTPAWQGFALIRTMHILLLVMKGLPSKRFDWLRQLIHSRKSMREKLAALHRYLPFLRGDWDIIYFPWNSTAIDYLNLFDLRLPVVLSCRGSQINIRPLREGQERYVRLLKQTLVNSTGVHCVSEDILRNAEVLGLDPLKAVIIHPAIDPKIFTPSNQLQHNCRVKIVTTGSLIWRKGYEYLLMSIKALTEKKVVAELHIIGEGSERNRILFTAQDLNITSQVILHGKLTPSEVIRQLQQSDIFVLSSLSEGISNAVLEAMGCGLPIVTTNCGGMREVVQDGVEGFIVPVRDPDAMADALLKLATDPDLRRSMGKAGRERVIAEFNAQSQIEAFVKLFESVRVNETN